MDKENINKENMDIEYQISESDGKPNRFVHTIHENIKSDLIKITEDKLKNIFREYFEIIEKKKDWMLPLSLLLSIGALFCTTDFKDAFGFQGYVWKAFYIFVALFMLFWFVKSGICSLINRKKSSIKYLIDTIKNVQGESESTKSNKRIAESKETKKISESELTIIEAKYGKNEKCIDVKKALNDRISNNKLNVTVKNKLFSKDPAPNVLKELIVTYSINDSIKTITIPEHGVLSLP
jgi:hypothetical protein